MRDQIQETFYMLLWMVDHCCFPSTKHVGDTFESWASRNGYLRDLQDLENRRLLRRTRSDPRAPALLVTSAGREAVNGSRDPEALWQRPWDGRWRLITFDLPAADEARRKAVRRFLVRHHFGCFQRSVWITPDPVEPLLHDLRRVEMDRSRVTVLVAQTPDCHPVEHIARVSWDFARINGAYRDYMAVLKEVASWSSCGGMLQARVRAWVQREQAAWFDAIALDPLLPKDLHPKDYLGQRAWRERGQTFDALTSCCLAGVDYSTISKAG